MCRPVVAGIMGGAIALMYALSDITKERPPSSVKSDFPIGK
jgi:hypothetical protein